MKISKYRTRRIRRVIVQHLLGAGIPESKAWDLAYETVRLVPNVNLSLNSQDLTGKIIARAILEGARA